jgi:hypothetical protein
VAVVDDDDGSWSPMRLIPQAEPENGVVMAPPLFPGEQARDDGLRPIS